MITNVQFGGDSMCEDSYEVWHLDMTSMGFYQGDKYTLVQQPLKHILCWLWEFYKLPSLILPKIYPRKIFPVIRKGFIANGNSITFKNGKLSLVISPVFYE